MVRADSRLQFHARLIFHQYLKSNQESRGRQLTKCWRENQEAADASRFQIFDHKGVYLSHNIGVC